MNITDVDPILPSDDLDLWADIFRRQQTLIDKYAQVERDNGFFHPFSAPVVFDDKHHQHFLKDMAWRVIEELAEAWEAKGHENYQHYVEELSDALHFMVELAIFSGLKPENLEPLTSMANPLGLLTPDDYLISIVEYLGRAMNCLKNKPWKTTHMLTDVDKYQHNVFHAIESLAWLMASSGLTPSQIWMVYVQKNSVNHFRIRSNY